MHILEEVEANYSLKAMQDAVVDYWNSCDLYELTIQRFSHKKYEYGLFLRESLEGISEPMYSDFNDENTVIQEALAIAQEQLRGSQLPPLELLSGRKEGNARVPLDEAALRQQKFALLRREYDVHYVKRSRFILDLQEHLLFLTHQSKASRTLYRVPSWPLMMCIFFHALEKYWRFSLGVYSYKIPGIDLPMVARNILKVFGFSFRVFNKRFIF